MSFVDLHCHSTASDGTLPPAQVVRLAGESGLSALALTDHDTVGGIAEAQAQALRIGLDFLAGIEISAEYPQPGTLHILGYGIDPLSPQLNEMMRTLLEGRDNRNPRIVEKLRSLGVAITMAEVEQEARAGSDELKHKPIGRPHIAAILLRKGYVTSIKQAFDKYLAPGGLAYFDKERLTPRQAIERIGQAGGVAVLAHPVQLRAENDAQLERTVKDLVDLGLEGIEVIHSDHDEAMVEKCSHLADRFGLLKTGGSDFHGSNKKDIQLGRAAGRRIPRDFFDALRLRLNQTREQAIAR
jgi:predicted metal-dependent phosphoesterase TrpH